MEVVSRDFGTADGKPGPFRNATDGRWSFYSSDVGCGNPQIGDWRWKWYYKTVPLDGVSVIAEERQSGDGQTFTAWDSGNDVTWFALKKIGRVQDGNCDATCMLDEMEAENAELTWILRLVGFLLMFVGLVIMGMPAAMVPGMVPILGELLEDLAGMMICAVCFYVALGLASLTIALSWLVVRPMLALPLLFMCSCCIGGAAYLVSRHRRGRDLFDFDDVAEELRGGYRSAVGGAAEEDKEDEEKRWILESTDPPSNECEAAPLPPVQSNWTDNNSDPTPTAPPAPDIAPSAPMNPYSGVY
eukprot:Hpha_TRINITY_DN16689_c0_g1::TRINITY_DN16689_c0_g1_i1::g.182944::m.182944